MFWQDRWHCNVVCKEPPDSGILGGNTCAEVIRPPKTVKQPHELVSPDGSDTRQYPYYWLRDDKRENAEVIQHLEVNS